MKKYGESPPGKNKNVKFDTSSFETQTVKSRLDQRSTSILSYRQKDVSPMINMSQLKSNVISPSNKIIENN